MARYGRLLTDAQWEKIRPLLAKLRKRPLGGRPRADDRKRQQLKWSESFMDASFAPAKKGTLFSRSEGPLGRGSE